MPKWVKNAANFVKETAIEASHYALDLTMGLANAVDENLAFGIGNKIRDSMGVEPYEPFDKKYYNAVNSVGEVGTDLANAYLLGTGVEGLTNSFKNITQAFKGGSKVLASADGTAVLTSSVDFGEAIDGVLGVIKGGSTSGWAASNFMYAKGSKYNSKFNNEYNTPGNNQAQNKQVDDIAKKLKLNKKQRRMLHDEITGQGYSYQQILEIAEDLFGGN